ncbi:aldehyde dehydrogenase family protein [Actinomadura fibrosa]|uniref:Aldehyde dehydrogenase family protein n=1 Tax=Actinomadura fibrosa TaxID=111802 RepID=A0ABW2XJ20_9ACTN|nr:aldehyde dehydrogenase family protein [Actinomadura fibrosa]
MAAVPVWSVDPRDGTRRGQVAVEATAAHVDAAVRSAEAVRGALADRTARAAFLRAAAAELEDDRAELIALADAETALGPTRLDGELARTVTQLRAFADTVDAGRFLDVIIDHPNDTVTPPVPDLRRYKIPIGVVAVYAASNFPFAFSIPGGDTASALAAGCPVVVKAHPDHPATSERAAAALRRAAPRAGLPEDVVQLVHGFDAGLHLVRHPLVAAAGFTGSIRGGRALFDEAAARPTPIPFHGELGSLNPVVVTEAAAAERAEEIGTTLAQSVSLGHGQFCVKPGLVLVPAGRHGDRLVTALAGALEKVPSGVLLDERMRRAYLDGMAARGALPGVHADVPAAADGAHEVRAGLLSLPAALLAEGDGHDLLIEECFGPAAVVVRYTGPEEVDAILARLPGNLTATLQISREEAEPGTREVAGTAARLLPRLTALAGRVVVNAWPTGVAVAPAQHHGGPYPASTSTSTSVGETAVERWLRPVVYQNTPDALLPPELREDNPLRLPRRVDGHPA